MFSFANEKGMICFHRVNVHRQFDIRVPCQYLCGFGIDNQSRNRKIAKKGRTVTP